MNSLFRIPLTNRYSELTDFIDKSAVKELETLYPELIAEIFNTNVQTNWGLRNLKIDTNYSSFQAVYNFLSPTGPMFKLCYKLLLDCHLRYEFPYQYLPVTVRNKLEDANDTSFYKQKLLTRSKSQAGNCLYLNAFEYYMFHFAYHLINPVLQLPDDNALEWDTVYLRLVQVYLDHFLPCMSSYVHPILNSSASSFSSQHTIGPFSPTNKSTTSIFREDVLKKMSPSPPPFTRSKSSSSAEIWRSELIATLFLDFWFSSGTIEPVKNAPYIAQRLWSIDALPSKEQLRCVRSLLRHLHYFSNNLLPEDCALNDLKREIISNNRRTIYTFFNNAMTQLPLDSSFKLLLEAWFTYIQPWRYANPYFKNSKLKENGNIERRWFSFIAENLVAYTRLYYIVLTRLSRCDLTTYKISSMSYRLMQVFSQNQLLSFIEEIENYLEEGRLGSINSWNSIIRQNIYSVEKVEFRYDGFHSQNHRQQVSEFLKQINESVPTIENRKKQLLADQNGGFLKWFREQLSGNMRYSSAEEIQQIEFFLTQTRHKLYFIHKIDSTDVSSNLSFQNNTSKNSLESCSSFTSLDSTDGNISTCSMSPLRADPKERRKFAMSFKYEGDPDLYPIRSWENKFLVRVLYYICLWINTQFRHELKRIYYENGILGGIARQILCSPQYAYYFEKGCTPDGYSRRTSTLLPPRISLRRCASYYCTSLFFIFYIIIKTLNVSFFYVSFFLLSLYFLYLLINSVFYPLPIPNEENTATIHQS